MLWKSSETFVSFGPNQGFGRHDIHTTQSSDKVSKHGRFPARLLAHLKQPLLLEGQEDKLNILELFGRQVPDTEEHFRLLELGGGALRLAQHPLVGSVWWREKWTRLLLPALLRLARPS